MMSEKLPPARCAFCGREMNENSPSANVLIQAKNTNSFICYECAEDITKGFRDVVNSNRKIEESTKETKLQNQRFTPRAVKEYLDEYIIEQDAAKKVLSVAVYNHYKILMMKKENIPGAEHVEKSNILMVGPSGVGKTALVKKLAKLLNVPFVIEDATAFSSTGYVGKDVEVILRDLLQAADGDIEKAQHGIVFIDEIDKTSRKGENMSTSAEPSHEDLQQALLKIIEGCDVDVAEKGQRHHPNASTVKINTENILFIVGGAFEGIEKIIAKRQKQSSSSIGYGSKLDLNDAASFNEYIMDIQTEDLRKFGLLPELLGRLPIISPLQSLSEESLIRILTEPKNSLVSQYQTIFKGNDVDLEFTPEALKAIARAAIEKGTGARSLRGILENVLTEMMYEIPEENLDKVIVETDSSGNITITKNEVLQAQEVI